ncbi:TraJ transfer ATPase [Pectobacterium atrosepticum ICMP 1526]|uniref:plasmid transfer ATPase TraJ n=1 Tax=Pectobacterium atrosepticum TaxID=29471 RepID=UPI0005086C34|nr:plasmid transfer ATPase TraJ [Pectobacterium atrosepticum]KFX10863.1 conjugal transfer protein [Pectobacterium atrosepticum]KMK87519.1 TraJ transfer ATPase [Pectobacterium atrosepticum ICMP 1526]QXE13067.1 plasmid transfer ATPase TraJ [Pectobacterium atrosepticum]
MSLPDPPDKFGIYPFTGNFTAEEFKTFFAWCARHAVSDVDLVGGSSVSVSRYGRRERCSASVLPNTLLGNMLDDLLGREIKPRVQSGKPSDRPIQIDGDMHGRYGLGRGERVRLRSHIIQGTSAREEKAISVTMRVIPSAIPDFMSMGIEPDLAAAMLPKNGLGFVCGETGSGKSTLLAALYRYSQDTHPDRKIVTYEDPVEYILGRTEDLLPPHQAQIGRDVFSFAEGLRSAMRRNPELIGIGEIRDTETAEAAVQAGQTGHLCIGTMHTRSPGETIPRILGLFNSQIRDAMAWALLGVLRFIVIQVLVKTTDGKRCALREYIVFTDELCNKLQEMPPEKWGHFLDSILHKEKRRIVDQVREMYIRKEIDRSEAMLYLPIKELTA